MTSRSVLLAAVAACGLVAGCQRGLSNDEFEVLVTWLTCDECLMQEREQVAAMGDRAVPFLVDAFDSLPGGRRELQRERYRRLYSTLSATGRTQAQFVDHYLQALDETVRTRVALSLGDLEAWNDLTDLHDHAVSRGYSADVVALLRAMTIREPGTFTISVGPTTAWSLPEPASSVELCNGEGTTPCSGVHVVTVSAVAEVPTSSVAPPFEVVALYWRPAGRPGPLTLAGLGSAPVLTDTGVDRFWTWTVPFEGAGLPAGPLELLAVGVDSQDQASATAANTRVTVTAGT